MADPSMRPILVLTGGPAVGKSTTASLVARQCARAAVIDVDDVRQFVVSGAAAPWDGAEGLAQHTSPRPKRAVGRARGTSTSLMPNSTTCTIKIVVTRRLRIVTWT